MTTFAVFLINAEAFRKSIFYDQWEWNAEEKGTIEAGKILDFKSALDSMTLLNHSIRKHHPHHRFVVMTDTNTSIDLPFDCEVVRYEHHPSHVALSRAEAYLRFLNESGGDDILFLDSDMLLQGSVEPLFRKEFDVGLTFAFVGEIKYLFSGAFLAVRRQGLPQGRAFLSELVSLMRNYPSDLQAWYGDQEAMMDYFRARTHHLKEALWEKRNKEILIPLGQTRFLMLPAWRYNWTYRPDQSPDPKNILIHFKGSRKTFMPAYFKEHFPD